MRKLCFVLLLLVLTACCALALAGTEYSLSPCAGRFTLDDSYIILTPDNLGDHPELLSNIGSTAEELTADWAERGVILQAWAKSQDEYLEVAVYQDDYSRKYFDLEQQTRAIRNEYKKAFAHDPEHTAQGYLYSDIGYKKQTLGGNFLRYKYKRTVGDTVTRGFAGVAIRGGYTIAVKYEVLGHALKDQDKVLNKILNTFVFDELTVPDVPAGTDASDPTDIAGPLTEGLIMVQDSPPKETNTDTFTVTGRSTPGARLIGVLMSIDSTEPVRFYTDVAKSGSFKMKVTMPYAGVWLLTLNLEINDQVVSETVFDTTVYDSTMLPLSLTPDIPEQLTGNELVITGLTDKGVKIQCIVENGMTTYDKEVTTNGTGKFTFKVPTEAEAEYNITLVLQKKGYEIRRITRKASRLMTETDRQNQAAADAIKPAYATLVKKLDTYIGRTMKYTCWITDIIQNGDEWIVRAATRKNAKVYSNYVIYVFPDEPSFAVGDQVTLYGKCIGAYLIQSEEGTESFPGFDFMFIGE